MAFKKLTKRSLREEKRIEAARTEWDALMTELEADLADLECFMADLAMNEESKQRDARYLA